jgi:hypothetical protein
MVLFSLLQIIIKYIFKYNKYNIINKIHFNTLHPQYISNIDSFIPLPQDFSLQNKDAQKQREVWTLNLLPIGLCFKISRKAPWLIIFKCKIQQLYL